MWARGTTGEPPGQWVRGQGIVGACRGGGEGVLGDSALGWALLRAVWAHLLTMEVVVVVAVGPL